MRLTPVKLEQSATEKIDDLRVLAREAGSTPLTQALAEYPNAAAIRLVTGVSPTQIVELEKRAAARGFPPRDSLTMYWRIDARGVPDPERFLKSLAQVPIVDLAYRELRLMDPAVDASNDVYASQQLHLNAAPEGINARWAWAQANGSGEGVGFVDIEQGWLLRITTDPMSVQHGDLPNARQLPSVPREMNPAGCPPYHHGTAVMGLVAGLDNDKGIAGIAPNVEWVDVASHFQGGTPGHVASAITAVLQRAGMTLGDVLLIEYQDSLNRPVETDAAVWSAIDLATGLGMIVLEPAGNRGLDLDTVPGLNRNRSGFRDSRAIIVGAGESQLDASGTGHDRWVAQASDFTLPGPIPPFLPVSPSCNYGAVPPPPLPASNFGSRVDCYAWGEGVVSSGYGWLGGNSATTSYTNRFGGTSAAAAIVAGAAVVLQGMHKAVKTVPLDPIEMRSVLSKYGTPQGTGQPGHIGVMPDLKQAATIMALVGAVRPPSGPSNLRVID